MARNIDTKNSRAWLLKKNIVDTDILVASRNGYSKSHNLLIKVTNIFPTRLRGNNANKNLSK